MIESALLVNEPVSSVFAKHADIVEKLHLRFYKL